MTHAMSQRYRNGAEHLFYHVILLIRPRGGRAPRRRERHLVALRIGGALGVIGIALTTMGGLGWNTFVGFALVGLGTANVIPQVIKTADATPGLPPGVAISTRSTGESST